MGFHRFRNKKFQNMFRVSQLTLIHIKIFLVFRNLLVLLVGVIFFVAPPPPPRSGNSPTISSNQIALQQTKQLSASCGGVVCTPSQFFSPSKLHTLLEPFAAKCFAEASALQLCPYGTPTNAIVSVTPEDAVFGNNCTLIGNFGELSLRFMYLFGSFGSAVSTVSLNAGVCVGEKRFIGFELFRGANVDALNASLVISVNDFRFDNCLLSLTGSVPRGSNTFVNDQGLQFSNYVSQKVRSALHLNLLTIQDFASVSIVDNTGYFTRVYGAADIYSPYDAALIGFHATLDPIAVGRSAQVRVARNRILGGSAYNGLSLSTVGVFVHNASLTLLPNAIFSLEENGVFGASSTYVFAAFVNCTTPNDASRIRLKNASKFVLLNNTIDSSVVLSYGSLVAAYVNVGAGAGIYTSDGATLSLSFNTVKNCHELNRVSTERAVFSALVIFRPNSFFNHTNSTLQHIGNAIRNCTTFGGTGSNLMTAAAIVFILETAIFSLTGAAHVIISNNTYTDCALGLVSGNIVGIAAVVFPSTLPAQTTVMFSEGSRISLSFNLISRITFSVGTGYSPTVEMSAARIELASLTFRDSTSTEISPNLILSSITLSSNVISDVRYSPQPPAAAGFNMEIFAAHFRISDRGLILRDLVEIRICDNSVENSFASHVVYGAFVVSSASSSLSLFDRASLEMSGNTVRRSYGLFSVITASIMIRNVSLSNNAVLNVSNNAMQSIDAVASGVRPSSSIQVAELGILSMFIVSNQSRVVFNGNSFENVRGIRSISAVRLLQSTSRLIVTNSSEFLVENNWGQKGVDVDALRAVVYVFSGQLFVDIDIASVLSISHNTVRSVVNATSSLFGVVFQHTAVSANINVIRNSALRFDHNKIEDGQVTGVKTSALSLHFNASNASTFKAFFISENSQFSLSYNQIANVTMNSSSAVEMIAVWMFSGRINIHLNSALLIDGNVIVNSAISDDSFVQSSASPTIATTFPVVCSTVSFGCLSEVRINSTVSIQSNRIDDLVFPIHAQWRQTTPGIREVGLLVHLQHEYVSSMTLRTIQTTVQIASSIIISNNTATRVVGFNGTVFHLNKMDLQFYSSIRVENNHVGIEMGSGLDAQGDYFSLAFYFRRVSHDCKSNTTVRDNLISIRSKRQKAGGAKCPSTALSLPILTTMSCAPAERNNPFLVANNTFNLSLAPLERVPPLNFSDCAAVQIDLADFGTVAIVGNVFRGSHSTMLWMNAAHIGGDRQATLSRQYSAGLTVSDNKVILDANTDLRGHDGNSLIRGGSYLRFIPDGVNVTVTNNSAVVVTTAALSPTADFGATLYLYQLPKEIDQSNSSSVYFCNNGPLLDRPIVTKRTLFAPSPLLTSFLAQPSVSVCLLPDNTPTAEGAVLRTTTVSITSTSKGDDSETSTLVRTNSQTQFLGEKEDSLTTSATYSASMLQTASRSTSLRVDADGSSRTVTAADDDNGDVVASPSMKRKALLSIRATPSLTPVVIPPPVLVQPIPAEMTAAGTVRVPDAAVSVSAESSISVELDSNTAVAPCADPPPSEHRALTPPPATSPPVPVVKGEADWDIDLLLPPTVAVQSGDASFDFDNLLPTSRHSVVRSIYEDTAAFMQQVAQEKADRDVRNRRETEEAFL